jgi:hypothetical protein
MHPLSYGYPHNQVPGRSHHYVVCGKRLSRLGTSSSVRSRPIPWLYNRDSSIVALMDSGYASILLNIENRETLKKISLGILEFG